MKTTILALWRRKAVRQHRHAGHMELARRLRVMDLVSIGLQSPPLSALFDFPRLLMCVGCEFWYIISGVVDLEL